MKKIFQSTQCLSLEEIQSYTKGDASEELRYKVENHIVDCPLCAEATEGYATSEVEDEDFSTIFQKIEERTVVKATPARAKRIIPWNSIAASLLFLLTVGAAWVYYQSDQSKNNYQAYFEKGKNSLATRAIDESMIPENMLSGIKLYQSKNFHGSLSFFEDYLQSNPESTIGSYYAGMSALNIGEQATAFNLLTTVRVNDENFYEEATWMLVGIALDKGEKDKARNYLMDLVKIKGGYYHEQATELLAKIK